MVFWKGGLVRRGMIDRGRDRVIEIGKELEMIRDRVLEIVIGARKEHILARGRRLGIIDREIEIIQGLGLALETEIENTLTESAIDIQEEGLDLDLVVMKGVIEIGKIEVIHIIHL
jgi:hypothetical protein